MKYIELTKANVSQDVLRKFDCGHPDFNDFLAEDALECAASGNGVTYVLVDESEDRISTIFAFCTLKATTLYHTKEQDGKLYRRKHFVDASQFMIPYEEDDELGKCTPMYLSINENIYHIFGVE